MAGKIIAVPTDTVPGLAVDNQNPEAIRHLYALKGRSPNKPLVVMVASLEQVKEFATIPDWALPLLKKNWPGPLTVVFRANEANKKHLTPVQTIGVRIPDQEDLLALLKAWGKQLGVTSANESGKAELLSLEEIHRVFGDRINFYLPAKKPGSGKPSTIIDATGAKLNVLRAGEVVV